MDASAANFWFGQKDQLYDLGTYMTIFGTLFIQTTDWNYRNLSARLWYAIIDAGWLKENWLSAEQTNCPKERSTKTAVLLIKQMKNTFSIQQGKSLSICWFWKAYASVHLRKMIMEGYLCWFIPLQKLDTSKESFE